MMNAAHVLFLCVVLLFTAPMHAQVFANLNSDELPLVVRQEKALNVLNLWRFMSEEFAEQFSPEDSSGIRQINHVLDYLTTKTAGTSASVSSPAEHYLIFTMAKEEALNRLDFSDASLQKFFSLNPSKYPCDSRAVVSELYIPTNYLTAVSSESLLMEVEDRFDSEPFQKVAYDITSRFQKPGTGRRGEVTIADVGEKRFDLYRKVAQSKGLNKPAGPYHVDEGILFLVVENIVQSQEDCYRFYNNRVIQDYGRVWLKKIYTDTLSTLTQELSPEVFPVTTSTQANDPALRINDHMISFSEARSTLPFLIGDPRSVDFWQSIQRQALEVELYYHSELGQRLKQMREFQKWVNILSAIQDAEANISAHVSDNITTEVLEEYYELHNQRYAGIGKVSFVLFQCEDNYSLDSVQCAATLAKLRAAKPDDALAQSITSKTLSGVMWNQQSREVQVATQALEAGEWSQVFTENGVPFVLQLTAIERNTPAFQDIVDWVKHDYIMEQRQTYWKTFAGITPTVTETKTK